MPSDLDVHVMASSPTQRSIAHCKALGQTVAIVEHWNPHAHIRQDLFGCIDLLVLDDQQGPIGVQACASASHAARRTKSINEPRLRHWLASGARFQVWSWGKRVRLDKRGTKRKLWTLRVEHIFLNDLPDEIDL